MKKPRIAYFGHHGTTRLQLKVHHCLNEAGIVAENPSFITFNSYWKRKVIKDFPKAFVILLPTVSEWNRTGKSEPQKSDFKNDEDLLRAWNLDKILRKKPLPEVAQLWRLTVSRCKEFLDQAAPDLVISEVIQSLPCYALFRACQRRGIPYIQWAGSRLPERMELYLDESGMPYHLDKGTPPRPESLAWARNYVENIVHPAYKGPTYMKSVDGGKKFITSEGFLRALRFVAEYIQGGHAEPTAPPFVNFFKSKLSSLRVRSSHSDPELFKSLEQVKAVTGKKVLFPLHVTPEASTDLWAPKYNNMLETAKGLIHHLPKDWTLVMKEHRSTVFLQRDPKELEALHQLPHSLLISPLISNEDLFKECQAFIVITGTFGLEVMAKGYCPITLGKPFYDLSGNTIPCESFEHFSDCLQQALSRKADPEKTLRFLASYYESTGLGIPHNPDIVRGQFTDDNIAKIAHSIRIRFLQTG